MIRSAAWRHADTWHAVHSFLLSSITRGPDASHAHGIAAWVPPTCFCTLVLAAHFIH